MKKFLIFVIIVFAGVSLFPQSSMDPRDVSTGLFVSDSLHTAWIDTLAVGSEDDDTLAAKTYKYLRLDFSFSEMNITVQDTGTTYDDSLKIEWGEIKYTKGNNSRAYTKTDTVWHPIPFIRDTTWTIVTQPLVDDASVHSYFVWCSSYWIIRISMINVQAVFNRVMYFYIQAAKKVY